MASVKSSRTSLRHGVRRPACCRVGIAVLGALLALSASATALARGDHYWGYDNLSHTNPASGTCPGGAAGLACTGWNNWDESDADWTSGRANFLVGFICQADGLLWGPIHGGNGESFALYGAWWSTWCPTHYNRVAVGHYEPSYDGSYNYLQGRWQIFP